MIHKHRFKKLNLFLVAIMFLFLGISANQTVSFADYLHSNQFVGQKIPQKNEGKIIAGQWGKLETIPVIVQPPAALFTNYQDIIKMINSSRQWTFKNTSLAELRSLFLNAGLDQKVCSELLLYTKPLPSINGLITTPPEAVFDGFTPEIRARLYPLIGRYDENITYCHPFHYNSVNAETWLLNSQLTKEQVKKFMSLVYIDKKICCISDLHLMTPLIKNNTEWINLIQTLYRTPALDVYLKIEKGDDINRIINYWKNIDRVQFISSKLNSVRNNFKDEKINVAALLAAVPRTRLNTFTSKEEATKYQMDCHWTTFNFFNDRYDDRQILLNNICRPLYPDMEAPKFGDIYLLTNQKNQIVHSCIYIANNLVYTKNGITSDFCNTPFIFSSLDKVIALYSSFEGPLQVRMFSRTVADTHMIQ